MNRQCNVKRYSNFKRNMCTSIIKNFYLYNPDYFKEKEQINEYNYNLLNTYEYEVDLFGNKAFKQEKEPFTFERFMEEDTTLEQTPFVDEDIDTLNSYVLATKLYSVNLFGEVPNVPIKIEDFDFLSMIKAEDLIESDVNNLPIYDEKLHNMVSKALLSGNYEFVLDLIEHNPEFCDYTEDMYMNVRKKRLNQNIEARKYKEDLSFRQSVKDAKAYFLDHIKVKKLTTK